MIYKIVIEKSALKFICKQPFNERKRIMKSIYRLPDGDSIKMSGNMIYIACASVHIESFTLLMNMN